MSTQTSLPAASASTSNAEFDVRWMVAGRLCLLALALLGSSVAAWVWPEFTVNRVERLYHILAVLFAFSAVSAWWLRKHVAGVAFTAIQLFADIVVITSIIYITGDTLSPFLFLYLPHVMAASILLSRRIALILSLVATSAYLTMVFAISYHYIPTADGISTIQAPSGGLLLQVVGLFSGMILIAVATSFLQSKLASSRLIAEQSKRDLSKLDQEQRALINGIQDGVISVTLDETVANLNQAARDLLHISELDIVGKPFPKLLKDLDPHSNVRQTAVSQGESRELEFTPTGSTKPVRLRYQGSPVFNETGQQTGMIFIFKDITKLHSIEEQFKMQERLAELLAKKESDFPASQTKLSNF
ncbi:MAG: PAS domain-containing protein, partial [Deltaproteobacteria bacterium]|nr:PAS domain-containing protein [Deltaproteobacteria bacterium]